MTTIDYVGSELDLFAQAVRWKSYFRSQVLPYVGRRVLEVGAGIGGTTKLLCDGSQDHWTCLEPDPAMSTRLATSIRDGELPPCCQAVTGTVADLPPRGAFDTVLYIDVLEHIADDRAEVQRAAQVLSPTGHLIVLSPAHNWLYSPFDQSIGHHRRYTRDMLRSLAADQPLRQVRLIYLDSVGLLASLANRLLLKQSMPTAKQIALWDRRMIPLSQKLDPLFGYRLGKSVLAVWRK